MIWLSITGAPDGIELPRGMNNRRVVRGALYQGFHCLRYVDNLATVVKEKFTGVISKRMQIALNTANNWCNQDRLSINAMKTQTATFTKKTET